MCGNLIMNKPAKRGGGMRSKGLETEGRIGGGERAVKKTSQTSSLVNMKKLESSE